jgi:RHS repeat-associated protein
MDGHRVAKSDGSRYWYDDSDNVLSTADGSNSLKRDYIFFNGQNIGWLSLGSGDPHYYLNDHLGSPRVIANGDGSFVSWEADYYPFGGRNVISNADSLSVTYSFTGYEFDFETGDYYANEREQSPTLGRFFSPDPGQQGALEHLDDPQAWNGYAYARNNPLTYLDPDGTSYRICIYDDGGVLQCITGIRDLDFESAAQHPGSGISLRNGDIYATVNGRETKVGTYQQTDVDISSMGDAIIRSPILQTTAATMTDARTYALWTGASVVAGSILYAGGAFGGSIQTLQIGAGTAEVVPEVVPTAGQIAQAERVMAQNGRRAVERAIRSLEKRIAEHEEKIRNATGHTSSMERELRNLRQLLKAYKDILGK